MSTRRLVPLILAGCMALLFVAPVAAAAGGIVIEAGALKPPVLIVGADEAVAFVNRSGRALP
jgi:hypothetical protein